MSLDIERTKALIDLLKCEYTFYIYREHDAEEYDAYDDRDRKMISSIIRHIMNAVEELKQVEKLLQEW